LNTFCPKRGLKMSRVGKYKREMERVKGVGNGKQKD
jgi:hypothetical protein